LKRYCLALDLQDDPGLIEEYKRHHRDVWPEVKASIVSAGIRDMEIYLIGNRLFMIMEVDDSFSFARKAASDAADEVVQQWEQLMWKYQVALPQARLGEKWTLMERVFSLAEN
jgi:L-rhamnose mutarotase